MLVYDLKGGLSSLTVSLLPVPVGPSTLPPATFSSATANTSTKHDNVDKNVWNFSPLIKLKDVVKHVHVPKKNIDNICKIKV